jgi:N-acetylmuramoyl-L-alanine amidase
MGRKKVWVDAGHGGYDPGAVSGGAIEAVINLSVAIKLKEILEAAGYAVGMSRDSSTYVSPGARARAANADPDVFLFLSLHCNAAMNQEANGIEAFTSHGQTKADDYAEAILNTLMSAFPTKRLRADYRDGDADKEGNFTVLTATRMPAVLIEMGFITNAEERAWLQEPDTQTRLAMAIATGVSIVEGPFVLTQPHELVTV